MVIVCCFKSLLKFFDVTIGNVAISAEGHQILDCVSDLASTHSTRFDVVDVYGLALTYLAGDKVSCGVAHSL